MKKLILGLALAAMVPFAHAGDDGSDFRFYAGIGISHGGDSLGSGELVPESRSGPTIPFTISPGTSTELRLGADYRLTDRIHLQASVGYADQSPQGTNGSLDFRETPVELLGFVNVVEGLRIGGGYRKSWAEFSATGVASEWPGLGRYTSSDGSVLEVQYLFSDNGKYDSQHNLGGFSFRVVNETLRHDDFTIDGHHYEFGVLFYY